MRSVCRPWHSQDMRKDGIALASLFAFPSEATNFSPSHSMLGIEVP